MRKKDKDATDAQDFTGMPATSAAVTAAEIQAEGVRVSRFGGYRMRDVDEFLDQITESMTRLADENQRLRPANGRPTLRRRRAGHGGRRRARPTRSSSARATEAAKIVQDARAQAAVGTTASWPGRRRVGGRQRRSWRRSGHSSRAWPAWSRAHADSVKGMAGSSRGKPAAAPGRRPGRNVRRPPARRGAVWRGCPGHGRRRSRCRRRNGQSARRRWPPGPTDRRPDPREEPATASASAGTRTMKPDRARVARSLGSCSGARRANATPCGGRPPVRRGVRPDRRRGDRVGGGVAGRRRPAAAGRGARRERRRPAPVVARRRQARAHTRRRVTVTG